MNWNEAARATLVVVMTVAVVYRVAAPWGEGSARAETGAKIGAPMPRPEPADAGLPAPVIDMREMILAAVNSGRLEDLVTAVDHNELPPEVGAPQGVAAIDHLRKISADGEGREMLALLGNLLQSEPARLPIGKDLENSGVYVWPAVSEAIARNLTPADQVALYRLMPVEQAKAMMLSKKWTWWRLAIGADGTWLTLIKRG